MADEFDPGAFLKKYEQQPSTGGQGGGAFDPGAFLKKYEGPSLGEQALDVAKQIPTGVVSGFENLVTWPAQLIRAGQDAGLLAPGGGEGAGADPFGIWEAAKPYLPKAITEKAGEIPKEKPQGIAKYLGMPEPTTTAGRYARTAAEMGTGALAAPGKLAVTIPAAVTGGLTSEAAGQALSEYGEGPEMVGRIGGALAGAGGLLGLVKAFRPSIGSDAAAASRLRLALERDGDTPEAIMRRLEETRKFRPEATIADVSGNSMRDLLETTAQTPAGRPIVERSLVASQQQQLKRIVDDLSAATNGDRRSAFQAFEEARDARKQAATPLWQKSLAEGDKLIWSDELERLSAAGPVKRAMHYAVKTWQDQQIADGYGAMNPGALVDRPGQAGGLLSMLGGKVPVFPNLQFWDYVKNGLDIAYKRSVRDTGPTKESARIATYLTKLRGELDAQVPSYAEARNSWAGHSAYMDAIEDGKNILNRNMTAEELAAQFKQMGESEREAYRIGAVSAIKNQMASNPAKMPDLTRSIRSQEMRQKLNVIMPTPEAAERFQHALSYEIGSAEVAAQALGNSATAKRLAAKEEGDSIYGELLATIVAHKAGVGWIRSIWQALSDPTRRQMERATGQSLARTFTSTAPTAQIAPRLQPSRYPQSILPGTARGVGLGLLSDQLQYTQEGYPYVQGGQGAQARQTGGTVPTIGGGRRRPLGARAVIALRKARARKEQALPDGGAQRFKQGGEVKVSKHSVNYSKGMKESHCGICRFYDDHVCEKVRGYIGAGMWCRKFMKAGMQDGGEVKKKSHERFAGALQSSPGVGGIFPQQKEGATKPKVPSAPSEADIAKLLRAQGITGEAAGGFAGSEFGPKVEQFQEGGEVKEAEPQGWPEDADERDGAFEQAAARVRRRYPTREPDPVSLAASQMGWAPLARAQAENLTSLPERAIHAAGELQRTGEADISPIATTALMTLAPSRVVGAPGSVVGAGMRVPGQTQRGIASVNLRGMPLEEALPIVRSERHIIPKGEEGEGFIGAPMGVRTREDLARMRNEFDAQVEEGMAGAPWYQTAQRGIKEMAGADPAKQHMLAREKALFSAQSTPDVNLGYTLQAHNAFQAGKPRPLVRTGQQARTYNEARAAGTDIPLGAKTDVYAGHLDPTREDPITGTNDIWHARAFGYTRKNGKPWDGALTAQQHAFMDAETMLAVDRANARALGGRTNWTAGEIQAAPWVARKTQGLMEQFGWPYAKAREVAIKTYNAYFDKYTAYGTHEATPGVGTGHLPGVAEGPAAERAAWSEMPESSWADPEGRDVMYGALGMYQRPIQPATGVFQGPAGMEFNPAGVSRPMVSMSGKAGERVMDPQSRALMTGAEASRAYIDAQNMGAFSMPIFDQKIGQMTSVWLPTKQPLTLEQIGALRAEGAKIGLPEVIDYGNGAVLTSFGEMPKGVDLSRNIKPGTPAAQALQQITGVAPRQAKLETGAVGYEEALAGQQGTGMATRILQKALRSADAPALIARLDGDLALRTKVMERLNRDAEYAARTSQPVRADVQRARRIIARDGFAGLFRALRAGVALPAAVVIPAVQALQPAPSPVE